MPELPTEQVVRQQPVAVGILATAALVGGAVLGGAAVASLREGWVDESAYALDDAPLGAQLVSWGVAQLALVMGGYMLGESIREMGRDEWLRTMAYYGGGLLAVKCVVDGVHWLRNRGESA
jgi:hypothetical protein